MKITVVMGFFLPVPPEAGGATEKSWHRLARAFAARGHEVTVISRRWPGHADEESAEGVRYLRIPGFDHRRRLWRNLLLDLRWSLRVHRRLPPADVAVVHAVALPAWLGRLRPAAGRVVVMPGRMPKGQYRLYRHLGRVLATSTVVRDRVLAENAALAPITRLCGYPIDWELLRRAGAARRPGAVTTLGYAGRLHPEKGVDLLAAALALLAADRSLPPWRVVLCGPDSVAGGGGGPDYRRHLEEEFRRGLPPGSWSISPPLFDESALAAFYASVDVFCYPSLAAQGETFGVAVAEAMAAGAAPVVSNLACFRDLVRHEESGLVFDHDASDAPRRLAASLATLLGNPPRRGELAAAAQAAVRRYDFLHYADAMLADFAQLGGPPA